MSSNNMIAFPTPLCKEFTPWTADYYKCVVLNFHLPAYHPVGTCKIGSKRDLMAVVDPQLKVIGLKKLRIVDASVMPRVPGGNTNAATIMIGEKGADMILQEWQGYEPIQSSHNKDEL
jgi:choline dehydrogenase-like flavoprotein